MNGKTKKKKKGERQRERDSLVYTNITGIERKMIRQQNFCNSKWFDQTQRAQSRCLLPDHIHASTLFVQVMRWIMD